jgi:extradiol dioxygenase family protein|tara:strand:- start:413 stop:823 length:411 start_codon:yes stop_codon:yes gene_type:complete
VSNRFHLAIEGGNLKNTLPFYTDVLGCKLDMAEEGRWQDVDFWGNELTLHESTPRVGKGPDRHRHEVDMGEVCVPHLGIHLPYDEYQRVRASVKDSVGFLDTPYVRFEGTDYEQETFFVEDPNYNVLEIKSMVKDG